MRPIRRGISPQEDDFANYRDAIADLISRLGPYCSYCERRVVTQLAVEHIEPKKGPFGRPELKRRWDNFLLACVNCNSTKGDKQVVLQELFLPDRDNTFLAFLYRADGKVVRASSLSAGFVEMAQDTLALTGLDKRLDVTLDENNRQIAIDRVAQRMEVWALAEEAKVEIDQSPDNLKLRRATIKLAQQSGFFSVWMTLFKGDLEMRNRLIDAFAGTRDSSCFDPETAEPISPAPNPDGLPGGGKI